jgi:hypothetical protein
VSKELSKEKITIRGVTYNDTLSPKRMSELVKAYFGAYPKLKEWRDNTHGTTKNVQTVSEMEIPTTGIRLRDINPNGRDVDLQR